MIASFFQSLEDRGVQFLLISGQAAVLYGAAEFSEDIDLWVLPTEANLAAFRHALTDVAASYYKLTPPFTAANALAGHGFHFTLGAGEVFLDVMGQPPRTRPFTEAARDALRLDTDWGLLPVVAIPDLVDLKQTQRLQDYAVVSRLTLEWVRQPARLERFLDHWRTRHGLSADGSLETQMLRDWAIEHVFTLDALAELLATRHLEWETHAGRSAGLVHRWLAELTSPAGLNGASEAAATAWMHRRMATLQAEDREYWKPIIRELRRLREAGQLMPVGSPV